MAGVLEPAYCEPRNDKQAVLVAPRPQQLQRVVDAQHERRPPLLLVIAIVSSTTNVVRRRQRVPLVRHALDPWNGRESSRAGPGVSGCGVQHWEWDVRRGAVG